MLRLENVSFSYGDKAVLQNFSLTVHDGECVAIKGPSGCGKTTVIRLLAGLCAPNSGTVIAPERVGVVFQEDRLLPFASIKRNLFLTSPDGGRQNAMQLLRDMGLGSGADTAVRHLSGGMKRRVAIVRALAFGGEALLLDEPFNGLDAENRRTAAGLILKTAAENRMPVLISSHIDEDAALLKARVFKF